LDFGQNLQNFRINHRGHNRKGWGAFEEEQPQDGPKGESSGSERVKEHGECELFALSKVLNVL
jgi:hypothetical protein